MMKSLLKTILLTLLVISAFAAAEDEAIVSAKLLSSVDKLQTGSAQKVAIEIDINEKWHINANDPGEAYLFPSEITFDSLPHVTVGDIDYPIAEEVSFSFAENPIFVYHDVVYAYSTVMVSPEYAGKTITLSGKIDFQACNDLVCLLPQKAEFSLEIPVAGEGETIQKMNTGFFFEDKAEN